MRLPGVPPVLMERGEQTNFVANRMVLADGQWLIPDSLLALIWGCDARQVNEAADRAGVAGVKTHQVIEIPCDLSSNTPRPQGGASQPNRHYTLADAIALCGRRTA